jgi:hypothetical protein
MFKYVVFPVRKIGPVALGTTMKYIAEVLKVAFPGFRMAVGGIVSTGS